MAKQVQKTQWTPTGFFLYIWILGVLALVVMGIVMALISGGFDTEEFAFTEFYLCRSEEDRAAVEVFVTPLEVLYVCGEIEANGIVGGALYVYRLDDLITNDTFSQGAGFFTKPMRYRKGFPPGEYTIKFSSARVVRAETTFTVIEGDSP